MLAGMCAWPKTHWVNTKQPWNWKLKVREHLVFHYWFTPELDLTNLFADLGSPPDDLSCNITTPNSVRLRWTDLNVNNLMSDYIQGYVLTYSKVVPPEDLISEYI